MADLIFEFFRNVLIGTESTIPGADTLAMLLTWASIILFFCVAVKLIRWAFGLPFGSYRNGRRN